MVKYVFSLPAFIASFRPYKIKSLILILKKIYFVVVPNGQNFDFFLYFLT
jgi:hypothetical protein